MLKKGIENDELQWKPGDLLRAYHAASEAAAEDASPDSKIKAYGKVIRSCGESDACRTDNSIKRNMVLYWTYNNLGDAWFQRNQNASSMAVDEANYRKAISYYREAADIAVDGDEKVNSLQRIAEIYKHMEDAENFSKIQEDIVESLDDEHKKQGYLKLASGWQGGYKSTEWLEKALTFVMKEKVSLLDKCQNTLLICEMLMSNYKQQDDKENYRRIERLLGKTALIALRDLEDKAMEAVESSERLEFYAHMLKIVNYYYSNDSVFKMKAIQKIVNSLGEGEVLDLEKLLEQN